MPVFHIDVHGKMDRKDNLDLDIGLGPMEHCWADKDDAEGRAEVAALKEHLAGGMREAFKCLKGKSFTVHQKQMHMTVEEDPYLNAYWGSGTFETISHQSVNLRMPAIQLEIPHTMRKELLTNDVLFKKFATALMQSYKYCVSTFKRQDKKPVTCGCSSFSSVDAMENARQAVLRDNGRPASKSLGTRLSSSACGTPHTTRSITASPSSLPGRSPCIIIITTTTTRSITEGLSCLAATNDDWSLLEGDAAFLTPAVCVLSAEETELMLRELYHIERTTAEKQI